jgi:magnesium chelatase family protein
MSLARTWAVALAGVDAQLVEIEADSAQGIPGVTFTGLADTSVVESRDRIRAAVLNSGATWPNRRITVAMLPADVRKVGSRFDLAVAVAMLACSGQVPVAAIAPAAWIAELGLDGRLRSVRGVLPSVVRARELGVERVVVAAGNGAEAALVPGLDVRVAHDLRQVIAWLCGDGPALPPAEPNTSMPESSEAPDLADVAGQRLAKRAVELAAAGGHHLFLEGAPGAGKTMLAARLPGLLPDLDDAAAVEVSAVHSVAGMLGERAQLIRVPPFQAPHHTASVAALVGGGSTLARPGAISLAHRGVLFLDEAPEFAPRALDALRQPLEQGSVTVHRGGGAVTYPARFLLVLAANPCPCGLSAKECICPAMTRRRYQQRLSGPLLDRIDLRVQVDRVAHADLFDEGRDREPSADVAVRVAAARSAAERRWQPIGHSVNAEVPGSVLRSARWTLPHAVLAPAAGYLQRGELTARGFDRVLRVAWTLADLAGRAVPDAQDMGEALYFRTGRSAESAA